jgi:hypothetical protein
MPRYLRWILSSILPSYFIKETRLRATKKSGIKLKFKAFVDRDNPPSIFEWRVTLAPAYDCTRFVIITTREFKRTRIPGVTTKCGRIGFICYFEEK